MDTGPKLPLNVTVVTGFFDIRRDLWKAFQRNEANYMVFFRNILRLDVDMVIFTEEKYINFVDACRSAVKGRKTTIVETDLEDLYMYKHKQLLLDIQRDPDYITSHPKPMAPEISQPYYNLVVCSKFDLLARGCQYAQTDMCVWFDAGYAHGTIDTSQLKWNPVSLLSVRDKISIIMLKPLEQADPDPRKFFAQYIDIINGGFIAGYKDTIAKVRDMYYELIDDLLINQRIKDDDQFYWTVLAQRHPEVMNLIPGDWYDGLKIP